MTVKKISLYFFLCMATPFYAQELIFPGDNLKDAALKQGGDFSPVLKTEENALHLSGKATGKEKVNYMVIDVAVKPFVIDKDKSLVLTAWSGKPQSTAAFYVRGFTSDNKCVLSWKSWNKPLGNQPAQFELTPEVSSQLEWEPYMVKAPLSSKIAYLRFCIGAREPDTDMDMFLKNISLDKSKGSAGQLELSKKQTRRFRDFGIAAPVAEIRTLMAAQDRGGRKIIICHAQDNGRRGYLLITDVETGQTKQYFNPQQVMQRDSFGAMLSSAGKFYYAQNGNVLEFDINTREWKDLGVPDPQTSHYLYFMEDNSGTIWCGGNAATDLISYNPSTGKFKNHGRLDPKEKYLYFLACDNAGWIYGGIGTASANLIAHNPVSGEKRQLLDESQRKNGTVKVYSGNDGNAYASFSDKYYRLSNGVATLIDRKAAAAPREDYSLSYNGGKRIFADGSQIIEYDLQDRQIIIAGKDGSSKTLSFNYLCGGANISSLAAGPDGKIYASTDHPMNFIEVSPQTGKIAYHYIPIVRGGNFCSIIPASGKVYGAEYIGGRIWEYDPAKPWQDSRSIPAFGIFLANQPTAGSVSDGRYIYMDSYRVLWFKGEKDGATGNFSLAVPADGSYYLNLGFYRSSSYGSVKIVFNGVALGGFNAQNEQESCAPLASFGPFELKQGRYDLKLILERNRNVSSHAWCGIYGIELAKEKRNLVITGPNPRIVAQWEQQICRPRSIIFHPDKQHLIMSGFPQYGYTGGGIGFYNIKTNESALLTADKDLVPGLSCIALAALPNGDLAAGTSTASPGGGHIQKKEAELLIIDWKTRKLKSHAVPAPGATDIISIAVIDNLIFGLTNSNHLFVFDPDKGRTIHQREIADAGEVIRHGLQKDENGHLYAILAKGIFSIDPKTFAVKQLGSPGMYINAGGALLDGKLYFAADGVKIVEFELPGQ